MEKTLQNINVNEDKSLLVISKWDDGTFDVTSYEPFTAIEDLPSDVQSKATEEWTQEVIDEWQSKANDWINAQ